MPQIDILTYYSQIVWNLLSSTSFYTLIIVNLFVFYCILSIKIIFDGYSNVIFIDSNKHFESLMYYPNLQINLF